MEFLKTSFPAIVELWTQHPVGLLLMLGVATLSMDLGSFVWAIFLMIGTYLIAHVLVKSNVAAYADWAQNCQDMAQFAVLLCALHPIVAVSKAIIFGYQRA